MHRLGFGVVLGLIVWAPAACGSDSNSAAVTPSAVPQSLATTPAETTNSVAIGARPCLWVQPLFPSDESLAAPVKGILRYDATNDCFGLDRDGVTYPVVWPEGTIVAASDPPLISAAGVEIRVGQFVSGGGGYLFVAEQLGIPPECLPPSGEVAVFNAHDAVTAADTAG